MDVLGWLKVPQLKKELARRDKDSTGGKVTLVNRFKEVLEAEGVDPATFKLTQNPNDTEEAAARQQGKVLNGDQQADLSGAEQTEVGEVLAADRTDMGDGDVRFGDAASIVSGRSLGSVLSNRSISSMKAAESAKKARSTDKRETKSEE